MLLPCPHTEPYTGSCSAYCSAVSINPVSKVLKITYSTVHSSLVKVKYTQQGEASLVTALPLMNQHYINCDTIIVHTEPNHPVADRVSRLPHKSTSAHSREQPQCNASATSSRISFVLLRIFAMSLAMGCHVGPYRGSAATAFLMTSSCCS